MNATDIAPLQQGNPIQKIAAKPKKRLFAKQPNKKKNAPPPMAPLAAPMPNDGM